MAATDTVRELRPGALNGSAEQRVESASENLDTSQAPEPNGSRRKRRFRRAGIALIGLIAVWAFVAGIMVVRGLSSANSAVATLEGARDSLSIEMLAADDPDVSGLVRAEQEFRDAHASLSGVWLAPVRLMPVVGRQLRAAEAMTLAGADLARTGVDLSGEAGDLIQTEWSDPAARAETLDAIADLSETTAARITRLDLGPGDALVGPLHDARLRLVDEIDAGAGAMQKAAAASRGAAQMLRGPSRYLFLAANNAEMRSGSGMFLSVGVLESAGGRVSVGEMRSVTDVDVPDNAVAVDGDIADLWGDFDSDREWRNLGVSPRFDVTARQAAEMWTAATGERVDGVIAADADALRVLVRATGPVTFDDTKLRGRQVVDYILGEQYREFAGATDARREQLGELAAAAVETLDRGDFDATALALGLQEAAAGRHILVWSSDPEVQAEWAAAGVSGEIGAHDLLVSILSRGGNKIDPFLDVGAELDIAAGGGTAEGTLELTVTNNVTEGEPRRIAGPSPASELPEGTYRGLVAVSLPRYFSDVRLDGDQEFHFAGSDGDTNQYVFEIRLDRQETETTRLKFNVPESGRVDVLPSARIPPIDWTADVDGVPLEWEDAETNTVAW